MLEEFIKLTGTEGNQSLYVRPGAIVAMCYDHDNDRTKITTLHGANIHQVVVKETPGQICDLCDKVRSKMGRKGMIY